MDDFSGKASLEYPWWVQSTQQVITPYDYPSERLKNAKRHAKAKALTLDDLLLDIRKQNYEEFPLLLEISKLVQDMLIHNPVFQPSERGPFTIKPYIVYLINSKPIKKYKLVYDPVLLALLGEGRCGQVARVLVEMLNTVGIKARVEQLNNHVAVTAQLNNKEYIVDADAFKNGIFFFKGAQTLFTKKEILDEPTIVDRFKHTGWMFREGTRYSINASSKSFTGYVDFFNPEKTGLISNKFGANNVYYPPGVPVWGSGTQSLTVKTGEKHRLVFDVPYDERADDFLVRIGKKSKKYSYDFLIYKNLGNETSDLVEETKIQKPEFVFSRTSPGDYYITVCSMSEYMVRNHCYIWWSDELKIRVV